MKERIEGRVEGDNYVVRHADGSAVYQATMADARADTKLAAAIARNGWQPIPEE